MAKKGEIAIPRGFMAKDGLPITTGSEMLKATCTCGIDCCNKLLLLEGYNSSSGDTTPHALYIVDGEVVIAPLTEAVAAVEAFKANTLVSATGVTIGGCLPGTLLIAATRQLTKTVAPVGSLQTGVWSTSAGGVATVSVGGLVTGVSAGTAIITFTTTDGAFTATCSVTVVAP